MHFKKIFFILLSFLLYIEIHATDYLTLDKTTGFDFGTSHEEPFIIPHCDISIFRQVWDPFKVNRVRLMEGEIVETYNVTNFKYTLYAGEKYYPLQDGKAYFFPNIYSSIPYNTGPNGIFNFGIFAEPRTNGNYTDVVSEIHNNSVVLEIRAGEVWQSKARNNFLNIGGADGPNYDLSINPFTVSEPGKYRLLLIYHNEKLDEVNYLHSYNNINIIEPDLSTPSINWLNAPQPSANSNGYVSPFSLAAEISDTFLTSSYISVNGPGDLSTGTREDEVPNHEYLIPLYQTGTYDLSAYASDAFGNDLNGSGGVTIKIDNTLPDIIVGDSFSGWSNSSSLTYNITSVRDLHSGISTYYWEIDEVAQDLHSTTLTVTPDMVVENTDYHISFKAHDNVGNVSNTETYTISFDYTDPTLDVPVFNQYTNSMAIFSTPLPEDSVSGINWDTRKCTINGNEYTITNNQISVDYVDFWGQTVDVIYYVEDNAGNSSTKILSHTFLSKAEFKDVAYSSSTPYYDDSLNTVKYPIELYFEDSLSSSDNVLYELDIVDSNDNTILSNYLLDDLNDIPNGKKLVLELFSEYISGGENLTYTIKTKYNNDNNTIELYHESVVKPLGKLGSHPILGINSKEYTNTISFLRLNEEFSNIDFDIDGNTVTYDLQMSTNGIDFISVNFIGNNDNQNIYKTIQLSSIKDKITGDLLITNSGKYWFKIISNDTNESDFVLFKYDNDDPETPVIDIIGDGIVNNNQIDIAIRNISDTGGSAIDKVLVWSRNISDSYSNNTTPELYNLNNSSQTITLANGRDGYNDIIKIYARTYDHAGNISQQTSTNVTSDRSTPTISLPTGRNKYYIAEENKITFSLNFSEACYYELVTADQIIAERSWSNNSHNTLNENIINLTPNSEVLRRLYIKDLSGNINYYDLKAYSLNNIEINRLNHFSRIYENGNRIIKIEFPTSEASKYNITDISTNNTTTAIPMEVSGGNAIFKFIYNEKKKYSFKVEIENDATSPDLNVNTTSYYYTPSNFPPQFSKDSGSSPVNNGYSNISGILNWPEATDKDGEVVSYKVIINGKESELLTGTTSIALTSIPGLTIVKNQTYAWNVIATDGYKNVNLKATADSFSIDGTPPSIEIKNIKNSNNPYYTDEIYFTITDDMTETLKNSGLSNVNIKLNGVSYTGFSASNGNYSINVSDLIAGSNNIEVEAVDKVSNSSNKNITIVYDKDHPSITEPVPNYLESNDSQYFCTTETFRVKTTLGDDISGVSHLYYGYSDFSNEPKENITWSKIEDLSFPIKNTTLKTIEVDSYSYDHQSKYLYIKVKDVTGKESISFSEKPIYFDQSKPTYNSGAISGFYPDTNVITNISNLEILTNFTDNGQGITATNLKYLLKDDVTNTTILLKDFGKTNYENVSLTSGNIYTIEVLAKNYARGVTQKIFNEYRFIFDDASPTNPNLTYDNTINYISGDHIDLIITASEEGAGLGDLTISMGTSQGSSNISTETISPIWSKTGNEYSYTHSYLLSEDMNNGTYYINVDISDKVNNLISVQNNLNINNSAAALRVESAGYTAISNNNSFIWSYNFPNDIDSVKYRISTNKSGFMKEISNPTSGQIVSYSDILEPLKTYYLEVQLTTKSLVTHNMTKTIIYDNTAPVINNNLADMFPTFIKPNLLKINWDTNDAESGIERIEHKIEKLNGSEWSLLSDYEEITTLSNTGSIEYNNLDIEHNDRIRVTQRVINGVGKSTTNTSPSIVVDNTNVGHLSNITDFVRFLKTSSSPTVSWELTETDNESGMDYYWAFSPDISNFDNIVDWNTPDDVMQKSVTVDLDSLHTKPENGEIWFFIIKGINGVGDVCYGTSDGIIFDNDAPEFAGVKLVSDKSPTKHIFYLTDEHKNLALLINATDVGNITYNADYGIKDMNGNYILKSDKNVFNQPRNDIDIEQLKKISGTIIFRADASDEANNENTWGGESAGTIFDNKRPSIDSVNYTISEGLLTANWLSTPGGSPLDKYNLKLMQGKSIIINEDVLSTSSSLDISQFDDGIYTLKVKAISKSGLQSQENSNSVISEIMIDNTAPVINRILVESNEVVPFVYKSISPSISVTEVGSSIIGYKYRIGTISEPGKLTDGWIEVSNQSIYTSTFTTEIDLTSINSAYEGIEITDIFEIECIAYDQVGNESISIKSNQFKIDKTLAENISISVPTLSNQNDQITGISIIGEDNESSIENIKLTLYRVIDNTNVKISELIRSSDDLNITNRLNDSNFTFVSNGLNLTNGVYRIQLDISNGTHLYNTEESNSEVFSNTFTIDITAPEITYREYTSYQHPVPLLPIFNNVGDHINFTVNEKSSVYFELFLDGEVLTLVDTYDAGIVEKYIDGNEINTSYIFNHNFEKESDAYGNYILMATVTDMAGNITTYENRGENGIIIRFNEPPQITFPDVSYVTTPGKPIMLNGLTIEDHDGDYSNTKPFIYDWTFHTSGKSNVETSTEINPIVKFFHHNLESNESIYTVELKVTDNNNKTSTASHFVIVKNTSYGEMYTDEVWNRDQLITDDVIVGDGITLNIKEDVNISFKNDSGITVHGDLRVDHGVTFSKNDDDRWKGIFIDTGGSGIFNGSSEKRITIKDAFRGITLNSAGILNLDFTLIDNNIFGIHAYDSDPIIKNSIISNNTAYGIKEDLDSDPVIDDATIIINNTINYYDSELTVNVGENN